MEQVKGLRLPSVYVEVTDNEMEYTDGGGWFGDLLVVIGGVVTVAACIAACVATAGFATPIVIAGIATTIGSVATVGGAVAGVGAILNTVEPSRGGCLCCF